MKGIVVDIKNQDSVVMTEDGQFTKMKNNQYEIGQSIVLKEQKARINISRFAATVASIAAAMMICTIGAAAYYIPTDYVSLDVNPSIEYAVNRFDRILKAEAINDDGEEILATLHLSNMKLEDAVLETLNQLILEGYLTDDPDGGVVITTSNDDMDAAELLAQRLEENIQQYLDKQPGIVAEVDAEAIEPARREEAMEMGISPGKLNLVEKLQASTDGAIVIEDWVGVSVKEINQAIKTNRVQEKEEEREANQTSDGAIELFQNQNENTFGFSGEKGNGTNPEKNKPELTTESGITEAPIENGSTKPDKSEKTNNGNGSHGNGPSKN